MPADKSRSLMDEIAHDPDFLRGREEARNGRGEDNTGDEFYDMGVKVGRQELREEWEQALDALDDALQNMQGTSPSQELGKNLAKGDPENGIEPEERPRNGYHAHHLVPHSARADGVWGALLDEARDVLKKFDLDIDGAANGVWLKGNINLRLNNSVYNREIAERIIEAKRYGKQGVLDELKAIKSELKADPEKFYVR